MFVLGEAVVVVVVLLLLLPLLEGARQSGKSVWVLGDVGMQKVIRHHARHLNLIFHPHPARLEDTISPRSSNAVHAPTSRPSATQSRQVDARLNTACGAGKKARRCGKGLL